MRTKMTVRLIVAATVAILGTQAARASSIILSPYNGPDLLDIYTDTVLKGQSVSGGISTPGLGTTGDPAGVTYLKYGGDQTTVAMLDGQFTGDKFFMGANLHLGNPKSTALMDSNDPAAFSPGLNWLWWDAHFTNAMQIDHFVIRTADAASARTPDQFQLRGSNDGGATWTVIYRLDANGDGTGTPWGQNPPNVTAVQFDRGVDGFAAGAFKEIRLEVFSATNNGDGVGLTEWQLAGTVASTWGNYLDGDFNKDGEVGPEDFGILKDGFGLDNLPFGNHESWTLGDANDDGEIGPEDFGLLKDNFGLDGGP
ncbi:MAG: hypothetical protein NTV86_22875, partial [Planctomycetota bacterium]|nr:hypothetical protein [Planctomycetota bacterium]